MTSSPSLLQSIASHLFGFSICLFFHYLLDFMVLVVFYSVLAYWFPVALITDYNKFSGFKQQKFILPHFCKIEFKNKQTNKQKTTLLGVFDYRPWSTGLFLKPHSYLLWKLMMQVNLTWKSTRFLKRIIMSDFRVCF